MSSTDKSKLDGVAAGAEVNVQSDWNQTTANADDYIKNKPTIPTIPGNASSTAAGLMSSTDKIKIDGVESGAEVNVQADWEEEDSTSAAYINNKPAIPIVPVTKIVAGTNVTISPTTGLGNVTINAASNHALNNVMPFRFLTDASIYDVQYDADDGDVYLYVHEGHWSISLTQKIKGRFFYVTNTGSAVVILETLYPTNFVNVGEIPYTVSPTYSLSPGYTAFIVFDDTTDTWLVNVINQVVISLPGGGGGL
jgi:hypothetical protein